MSDSCRTSMMAQWLAKSYVALNCPRRRRVGAVVIGAILRLEGGPFFSRTARRLLQRHHGVDVGPYSYGPFFAPGVFPTGVSIGNYVSVAPSARVFPRNHPLDVFSTHPLFYEAQHGLMQRDALAPGSLRIEHDAWLGAGSIVTPGCRRIGIGAVVGAGAVVTRDVANFAIVAGNPARVIRSRFDSASAARLLASEWWTLPPDKAVRAASIAIRDAASAPATNSHVVFS
jgi:acetyltransferase-like isoleucine patch superfamily enzyme